MKIALGPEHQETSSAGFEHLWKRQSAEHERLHMSSGLGSLDWPPTVRGGFSSPALLV